MRASQSSSLSVMLHVSMLAGLAAMSALRVLPLPDHGWRVPIGPLRLDLAAAGGAGSPSTVPPAAAAPGSKRPVLHAARPPERAMEPQTLRQPAQAADSLPASTERDATDAAAADETATPDAALDGAAAGDPNGRAGGAPDGSPDGVIGGLGAGSGGPGGPGGAGAGPAAGAADDDVLYFDGSITLPVAVRRVDPIYPPAARAARLEATLRFQIVVDRNGDVIEVKPLSTHPVFERAAIEALSQWKYRPAMQAGRPVKVYLLVTVAFRLLE